MTIESWRKIPSLPEYDVSSEGRVRRNVDARRGAAAAGQLVKPISGTWGTSFSLYCRRRGRSVSRGQVGLMKEVGFIGDAPATSTERMVVLDGVTLRIVAPGASEITVTKIVEEVL